MDVADNSGWRGLCNGGHHMAGLYCCVSCIPSVLFLSGTQIPKHGTKYFDGRWNATKKLLFDLVSCFIQTIFFHCHFQSDAHFMAVKIPLFPCGGYTKPNSSAEPIRAFLFVGRDKNEEVNILCESQN